MNTSFVTDSNDVSGQGKLADFFQETFALTRRLFIQLVRRPSTLVAGILQPLIWLILFGALFSKAPEGLLPGGGELWEVPWGRSDCFYCV